ncbi:MAG TPA: MauE/DoxX family redox-associated membrane protein [Actinomycetota bacterium]
MAVATMRAEGRVLRLLHLASRLALGGLLLWAGLTKVGDVQGMTLSIDSYQILPGWSVRPLAAALPWIEVALGAFLVLGIFVRFSAVATGVLLVAFLIGMAQAKARGLAIDCGCFGAGGPGEGVSWFDILRDVALIGVAGLVLLLPADPWGLDVRLDRPRHGEET